MPVRWWDKPDVDVLVGMADAVLGQDVGLQQPPDDHRRRGEQHEADDRDHQERDDRAPGRARADARR